MEYRIDTKADDFLDVIEKVLNKNGVKIKTDFDISFSTPNLSDGLDFSEHDAKIRKEMEYEIRRLTEENARLEKENSSLESSHIKLYNDTKDEIRRLKEENMRLQKELQAEKECYIKVDDKFFYIKSHEVALSQENIELRKSLEEYEKDGEEKCCGNDIPFMNSDDDMDDLLLELQDQHQQDCIRINDLTTTVNVLTELYANLRKNVGMD